MEIEAVLFVRSGGRTRLNLASGGHTLPEETGASRLAPALIAFTDTHTHSLPTGVLDHRTQNL